MLRTFIGTTAVVPCCRCLVGFVTSRDVVGMAEGCVIGHGSGDADEVSTRPTWDRHISKIEAHVAMMVSRPGSAGFRAAAWKTYVAPRVVFLAQLRVPLPQVMPRLQRWLGRAMGLGGWPIAPLIVGLSVVRGAEGGPRCFESVALAAEAVAWLRSDFWGRPRQRTQLSGCSGSMHGAMLTEWSQRTLQLGHGTDGEDGLLCMEALVRPDFGVDRRDQVCGKGGAVRRLVWGKNHGSAFKHCVVAKSRGGRWLPMEGGEWSVVRAARSFTQSYHVFRRWPMGCVRVLAGARAARTDHPCARVQCGAADVAWV